MHTVEEALRRGITVMAVPGSVRNPAAAGTNLLLSEGCAPACSTEDVLTALGLATEGRAGGDLARPGSPPLDQLQQRVLDALDDGPVSLDRLVMQVGSAAPEVLVASEHLERHGLLAREGGRVMRA